DRRAVLEDQMELLDQAVRARAPDYQLASYPTPDPRGLGAPAGAHPRRASASRRGRAAMGQPPGSAAYRTRCPTIEETEVGPRHRSLHAAWTSQAGASPPHATNPSASRRSAGAQNNRLVRLQPTVPWRRAGASYACRP